MLNSILIKIINCVILHVNFGVILIRYAAFCLHFQMFDPIIMRNPILFIRKIILKDEHEIQISNSELS